MITPPGAVKILFCRDLFSMTGAVGTGGGGRKKRVPAGVCGTTTGAPAVERLVSNTRPPLSPNPCACLACLYASPCGSRVIGGLCCVGPAGGVPVVVLGGLTLGWAVLNL